MFREKSTEEILKLIDEAQKELENRRRKRQLENQRYEVTIIKYVGPEMAQVVLFDGSCLDDLVVNIDKAVEQMRPTKVSKETEEMFNK